MTARGVGSLLAAQAKAAREWETIPVGEPLNVTVDICFLQRPIPKKRPWSEAWSTNDEAACSLIAEYLANANDDDSRLEIQQSSRGFSVSVQTDAWESIGEGECLAEALCRLYIHYRTQP